MGRSGETRDARDETEREALLNSYPRKIPISQRETNEEGEGRGGKQRTNAEFIQYSDVAARRNRF